MQTRRTFIRQLATGTGLLLGAQFPWRSLAAGAGISPLTILHTNDTHSRLDPFPDNDRDYPGLGGVAARAALISRVRSVQPHVLLLDAGDFFQGTPYFDLYQGAAEIKAMNLMQYDAACLGSHELDAGPDLLAERLTQATFPVLCANYSSRHQALNRLLRPFTILEKGPLKIGIFGIGTPIGNEQAVYQNGISSTDPISSAAAIAASLRGKHHCDLVICLSRLGLNEAYRPNDRLLVRQTEHIDLVIGGGSHSFLDQPLLIPNRKGKPIPVTQAGWGGVRIGRVDYIFSGKKKILSANVQTVIIRK